MTDLRQVVNTFFRQHEKKVKKLKSSSKFVSQKGKLHLHVSQVLQVLQSGQWVSVTGVTGWTVGQWYNGTMEQWGSCTV